jgi:hypothetical protein
LLSSIYGDADSYRQALQTHNAAQELGAAACLEEFDSLFGAPVIDYASNICEGPAVVGTFEKDGRVVREDMSSGPDVVIAYDNQGNPHRFNDEPITKLPVDFNAIPDWRAQQLNESARGLIDKYYNQPNAPDHELSFGDIANIMKDISQRQDLTEVEKCALWTQVHGIMGREELDITADDEKPEMVDSWKGSSDPWHALIGLNDGYHADRLVNMSPEDASKAIFEHEDSKEGEDAGLTWRAARFLLGINQGDINASEGQLQALRQLREQGTFAAYAQEWGRQFVRKDG